MARMSVLNSAHLSQATRTGNYSLHANRAISSLFQKQKDEYEARSTQMHGFVDGWNSLSRSGRGWQHDTQAPLGSVQRQVPSSWMYKARPVNNEWNGRIEDHIGE